MSSLNPNTHTNDIIQTATAAISDLSPHFDFSTKYPPNHVKKILDHVGISTSIKEIDSDRIRIDILDFNLDRMIEKGIMPKHSIA